MLYPNPLLQKKLKKVETFDQTIIDELDAMTVVMKNNNGIGISANQCGLDKAMFILKDKTTEKVNEFINPQILERGQENSSHKEGCLSAPGINVFVPGRSNSLTVKYQDRSGQERFAMLEEIEAVAFQHEFDHIEGIFFLSRLPRIQRRVLKKKLGYDI